MKKNNGRNRQIDPEQLQDVFFDYVANTRKIKATLQKMAEKRTNIARMRKRVLRILIGNHV